MLLRTEGGEDVARVLNIYKKEDNNTYLRVNWFWRKAEFLKECAEEKKLLSKINGEKIGEKELQFDPDFTQEVLAATMIEKVHVIMDSPERALRNYNDFSQKYMENIRLYEIAEYKTFGWKGTALERDANGHTEEEFTSQFGIQMNKNNENMAQPNRRVQYRLLRS